MAGSQNRSIQVHHEPMAVASRLPFDRSQRADIRPAVEDVRAMPAIILPAGAREAFQKSDRGRQMILSGLLDCSVVSFSLLPLPRRNARNSGSCTKVIPSVDEDVRSGKKRPKCPPRGLRRGIGPGSL